MPVSEAAAAGAWVVVGGSVVKIASLVFGRSERILREAQEIRADLRRDIAQFKIDEDRLRAELNAWQQKYYEMMTALALKEGEIVALRTEVALLRAEVRRCQEQHEERTELVPAEALHER